MTKYDFLYGKKPKNDCPKCGAHQWSTFYVSLLFWQWLTHRCSVCGYSQRTSCVDSDNAREKVQ